jgi:uncharacterized protein (TIGR00369 family)
MEPPPTRLPAFMTVLGLSVERADAEATLVRMAVPEFLLSPFGAVQGGAIAALFDVALAIAIARRLTPSDRIATHNLNVTFVAFTSERTLDCRARVVSLRRSVAVAEGEILSAEGVLVAKALGTFGVRRLGGGE